MELLNWSPLGIDFCGIENFRTLEYRQSGENRERREDSRIARIMAFNVA